MEYLLKQNDIYSIMMYKHLGAFMPKDENNNLNENNSIEKQEQKEDENYKKEIIGGKSVLVNKKTNKILFNSIQVDIDENEARKNVNSLINQQRQKAAEFDKSINVIRKTLGGDEVALNKNNEMQIERLDKPIMTKNGACDEIAYAYEGDDKCMLIDKVGNFINDKVFKEIRHVFPNGYIIACYDLPSENKLNIFDLNNNCTPVFDEPFFRINRYYARGDGLMSAERYENGNIRTFLIGVNGFEFDYSKFYEKVVKKYDYDIKNIIINVKEMIRRRGNFIDGDVYSYIDKELNKIIQKVGDEISHVRLDMDKLKKDLYYSELFCKLPKLSPRYYG